MNWLGKMFKRKKSDDKIDKFKLAIIDENSELTHIVLGITDKRMIALKNICTRAYSKHDKLTSAVDDILKECNHINEVVVALFIYQKLQQLDSLESTLKRITNGF